MNSYTKFRLAALLTLSASMIVGSLGAETTTPNPSVLALDQTMYFQTAGGTPIQVKPGDYVVEGVENGMRLIPASEEEKEMVIEADRMAIEGGMVVPIPGETADLKHFMLLMPDGTAYETVGSHTGVWPRGLMGKIRQPQAKQKERKCPPNAKCMFKKPRKGPKYGRRVIFSKKSLSAFHSAEGLETIAKTLCTPIKPVKKQRVNITSACEKEVAKALKKIQIPYEARIGG